MKNWFDDVFLPSLFDYAGTSEKIISEKQLMVFERQDGVKIEQFTRQNSINGGFYVFGGCLHYEWRGRIVNVYPLKNGKAKIHFGFTEGEHRAWLKSVEEVRMKKSCESASKLKKRDPEKFFDKLRKAEAELLLCIKLLDAAAASEDDSELEDSIFDLEEAERRYYKYYFA